MRALLVGTIAVAVLAPAAVASAAPTKSLQQQIDEASANLEKITEQYNKVTEELHATQAAQTALQVQLGPLQASMDDAYKAVSWIATKSYESAPLGKGAALLQAGSPAAFIDQLAALDQIGRQQHNQIAGYEQAKSKFDGQKQQLDNANAAQTAQQQSLTAQKTQIETDLKALYALRTKAYGTPTEPAGSKYTGTVPAVSGSAGVAVRFAYAQIGKPYVYAADGPDSYDCSGLTMAAWRAAGTSLPHNAAEQWSKVHHIPRDQLAAGDLVFYNGLGHVAIYVGNNQVIHSPHAGSNVSLVSINVDSLYGYGRV